MASNIRQIPSGDSSGGFKAFDVLSYGSYGFDAAISYSSNGMTVTKNPPIYSGWKGAACYYYSSSNNFAGYNTVRVVAYTYYGSPGIASDNTYNANVRFSLYNTRNVYVIAEV